MTLFLGLTLATAASTCSASIIESSFSSRIDDVLSAMSLAPAAVAAAAAVTATGSAGAPGVPAGAMAMSGLAGSPTASCSLKRDKDEKHQQNKTKQSHRKKRPMSLRLSCLLLRPSQASVTLALRFCSASMITSIELRMYSFRITTFKETGINFANQ